MKTEKVNQGNNQNYNQIPNFSINQHINHDFMLITKKTTPTNRLGEVFQHKAIHKHVLKNVRGAYYAKR